MKIGYARVSTDDQKMDLQQDALNQAGCEKIFLDTISGANAERQGLNELLKFIREGDTLIVWRLDRLGRSLPELIKMMGELEANDIAFESITERIDTQTAAGQLIFHVFASLAEFERRLITERKWQALELQKPVAVTAGVLRCLKKRLRPLRQWLLMDKVQLKPVKL